MSTRTALAPPTSATEQKARLPAATFLVLSLATFAGNAGGAPDLARPLSQFTQAEVQEVKNELHSSRDAGFSFFLDHVAQVNAAMSDEGYAQQAVARIIFDEQVAPLFPKQTGGTKARVEWKRVAANIQVRYPGLGATFAKDFEEPLFRRAIADYIGTTIASADSTAAPVNWNAVAAALKRRFPGYDSDPMLLKAQSDYFLKNKRWDESGAAAGELIRRYGDQILEGQYMRFGTANNMIYWNIFLHCENKGVLRESSSWMKRLIDTESPEQTDMDTYANLLYKSGDKEGAIRWEKKALQTWAGELKETDLNDLAEFVDHLNKMVRGTPTWESAEPSESERK